MEGWLETLGVLGLAGVGSAAAWWFSRRPGRGWMWGYVLPVLLLLVILAAGYSANLNRRLEFQAPFSFLMGGRVVFGTLAFVAAMILTSPLLKLPRPRERRSVALLLGWFVCQICAWPFLAPVYHKAELAKLMTIVDREGVCRQGTDYTCGPAAAVTLLRQLGWHAEEGELAIAARTSRALGTPPSTLCRTLMERYRGEGLHCEYRPFDSVAQLGSAGPTLAVVRFGFLTDHYVAVLRVGDGQVEVGDPLLGRRVLDEAAFAREWRFVGIELQRRAVVCGW